VLDRARADPGLVRAHVSLFKLAQVHAPLRLAATSAEWLFDQLSQVTHDTEVDPTHPSRTNPNNNHNSNYAMRSSAEQHQPKLR
jgi:hypothetical protein